MLIPRRYERWMPAAFGGLIVLLTFLAYFPALWGGQVFDDNMLIFDNARLCTGRGLYEFWFTMKAPDYFPLTSTLWWVEWHLWGNAAVGYHLVTLGLHVCSALLLWRVARALRLPGAALAGVLFALHPVNVATAAWLSEQKNTLSVALYLLATLLYLRYERTSRIAWYAAATAAFCLALLAKPVLVGLPLILLVLAWMRRGGISRRDVLSVGPWIVLSIAMGVVTVAFQHRGMLMPDVSPMGWRVARSAWVFLFYVYKGLLPVNLMGVYPRWVDVGIRVVDYVPGVLLAAAFFGLWLARGKIGRGPLAVGLCLGLALGPVLGLVNMMFSAFSWVSDHLAYAGMPVICVAMACGVVVVCRRFFTSAWVTWAVCGALVAGMWTLSWARAPEYRSDLVFWTATAMSDPGNMNVQYSLGDALQEDAAEQVDPAIRGAEINDAIEHLKRATKLGSGEAENNLAGLLYARGDEDDAIAHYEASIAYNQARLGTAGDESLRKGFRESLAKAHFNLGVVLCNTGKMKESLKHMRQALEMKPDFPEAQDMTRRLTAQGWS